MQTIDYDYTIHQRPGAGDDSLLVKFFINPVEDKAATKKEGRPIFREVEWIDIRIPGSKDNVVVRPVRPKDMERFPRHYAAFKNRVEKGERMVGTPLETWPMLTRSQCEELKFFNIQTVEQLAAAPDSTAQKFMGLQKLKQQAKDFLEAAKSAAPLAQMREEIDALKAQNAELIAELRALRKKEK